MVNGGEYGSVREREKCRVAKCKMLKLQFNSGKLSGVARKNVCHLILFVP
jgi:hypothetical protein